jgi:pyruvate/2-oxoglutarate dehydrogenase complex dihydrolipoamide dehydrogenase (E3) component
MLRQPESSSIQRKFVKVDEYLRTTTPHIFAAGDITGHLMLVPQAIQGGWVAATNAVKGSTMPLVDQVSPMGSFTEPEYAQVGLTEAKARYRHLDCPFRCDHADHHRRAHIRLLQVDHRS